MTLKEELKAMWNKYIMKVAVGKEIKENIEKVEDELHIPEKTIDFKDVQNAVSNIKGSSEAVERVIQILRMKNIKIFEKIKIDAGKWRMYILNTSQEDFLVAFKSNWLWNFGKMFNRPEKEGTGLNMHIAKYCQLNGIDNFLIVRSEGTIYSIGINDLMDYATTHNTIRGEQGSFEAHVPVNTLKLFTIKKTGGNTQCLKKE